MTNTNDSGPGSLRLAIDAANASSESDTITITASGVVELQSVLPSLEGTLTINGPGAALLDVTRSRAAAPFRIVTVDPAAAVAIRGLTVSGGLVNSEDASCGCAEGAGIANRGDLSLDGVAVTNNRLEHPSIYTSARGAGISSRGELTISASTVANNVIEAADGLGAGIWGPRLVLENTTVSSNVITVIPDGIYNGGGAGAGIATGPSVLRGVTLAGNEISSAGSLNGVNLYIPNPRDPVTVRIENTLVAHASPSAANCWIDAKMDPRSPGFNLDDGRTCRFVGSTDLQDTDPLLGPLADNGGPTQTHALGELSPAIDAGTTAGLGGDQRGFARPVDQPEIANAPGGDGSDIGAFEAGLPSFCRGEKVTIVAEPGTVVLGTSDADVILGTPEPDVINASGGRDLVCGGHGKDTLRGGTGKDVLRGGPGKDRLRGGSGDDICRGGPGRDRRRSC